MEDNRHMKQKDPIVDETAVLDKNPEVSIEESAIQMYKDYILELAQNHKSDRFFNSSKEHAVIVMSTIFNESNNEVIMFSGNLNGGISEHKTVKDAVKNFLAKPNSKLTILLNSYSTTQNRPSVFDEFIPYLNDKKKFEIYGHKKKINNTSTGQEIHFCVGDGKMYRLETDVTKFTAIGSFSDPRFCQILNFYFNDIMNDESKFIIDINK